MEASTNLARPADFLGFLPFVQAFKVTLIDETPGAIAVEAPYIQAFSTPPDLFPASTVGAIGDIAAVSACLSLLPSGWATATLDFTVKMTGVARGEKLIARGRVLQNGKTISVATADVFCVQDGVESLCGTVLSTARNYRLPVS